MKESEHMLKLTNVLHWLDDNILLVLTGFMLAFVPLYPKIPLADILPGYIVRVRLEDFFIALTTFIFFIQLIRRKVTIKTPISKFIFAYLIIGFLSSLSAIFITKTVPFQPIHIQKLFLNYFRRIEYVSLFFVAFAAIKSKKDMLNLLSVFVATVLLVGVYGFGQKFFYWPVYSTMNREFSKGLRLYLTEHARVQSTFGGHYDFAGFLVIALPFVVGLLSYVKTKKAKIALVLTFFVSLWGLMMTSSRSSFLAFVFAMVVYFALELKKKGFIWVGARMFSVFLVTGIFFVSFGDLSERFMQIFNTGALQGLQNTVNDAKKITTQPLIEPPKDGISIDDVTKAAEEAAKKAEVKTVPVIVPSDTQPTPVNPQATPAALPGDVFEDIPEKIIATKSAEGKDIEVRIPRVFSENAHLLGLSAAIRLDTLWPFAIRGFLRNPALGSGYSTLTKYTIDEFTEAESTDNDFLRTLGETGLLGFITFYGTFVAACIYLLKKAYKNNDALLTLLSFVFVSITMGLFVNAVYIDLFVSSKVIETYWMIAGISLSYAVMYKEESTTELSQKLKAVSKKKSTFKRKK